jgi:hypothetical protein
MYLFVESIGYMTVLKSGEPAELHLLFMIFAFADSSIERWKFSSKQSKIIASRIPLIIGDGIYHGLL